MLKRLIIIFIVLIAGSWLIFEHPTFLTDSKSYISQRNFSKVFSDKTTLNQVSEEAINNTDIIEFTNKERVAVGLPPLSVNTKLGVSAEIKTDDMIARQYFEHESPTGEGVSDLGKKAGYEYVIMGENLAMGTFTSSEDIVKAWMNSPGHKANILNKKYQEIGVSVKRGSYEGKEVWFAVQHFGTSRSVCPDIDINLKNEIADINASLKIEEGIINDLKKTLEAPGAQNSPSYQSDVQTFNKNVDAYNAKLQISRQKIETYNVEIRNFNRCIATFS
jgi:uncharacterized protein YkwD